MSESKPTAVIVGSHGQDGQLLTVKLQGLGYEVYGLNRGGIDIADPVSVTALVSDMRPKEIYYLAAHHHSSEDEYPVEGDLFRKSINIHAVGAINFLDAIRSQSPSSRFFFASSCLVFSPEEHAKQNEDALICPESAYAISKLCGMMICRHYREKIGVFASVGILYNHESPLRSISFVTRKIASAAARIAKEGAGKLVLGNVEAKVDWGYAPDYVDAMYRILQTDQPAEYVIATGEAHTVREFADIAFKHVGLDYQDHITEKPQALSRKNLTRIGDSSRLKSHTGWEPTVSFRELVCLMVDAELQEHKELVRSEAESSNVVSGRVKGNDNGG